MAERDLKLIISGKNKDLPRILYIGKIDPYGFTHTCNGDKKIRVEVYGVDYDPEEEAGTGGYMDHHEGKPAPSFVIAPNHPFTSDSKQREQALMLTSDLRRKGRIAEELIDRVCIAAGCEGGKNCYIKR